MPLSREDFIKASRGEPLAIPPQAFNAPEIRDGSWPDYPDLRRAVEWFKNRLGPSEWERRRDAAFTRYHGTAFGIAYSDGKGRYFDAADTFAWYLFLADAFLDHVWNYDPTFGSRVIPIFAAIGSNLELLKSVDGLDERVARLVDSERSQPNGGIFELLVAAAYRRAGWEVAFRKERPGIGKTYDMDVRGAGRELAVECKRLETSDYGERERARMREIWDPVPDHLASLERSTFGNVRFVVPLFNVPDDYLINKVSEWLVSGRPSLLWADEISSGVVGDLDLEPLQEVLKAHEVLIDSTRMQELLSGQYVRHASYLHAIRFKPGMSQRYVAECDLAIAFRWQSLSPEAITAKAKDVLRKIAEANRQLPADKPGTVHIGFEAVDGDEVERVRFKRILGSTGKFDPRGKPLQYVYCHYFVPECPPNEAWAFDETVQWRRITGRDPRPLESGFLILPDETHSRLGPHWADGPSA
jgi:hypothetical protein